MKLAKSSLRYLFTARVVDTIPSSPPVKVKPAVITPINSVVREIDASGEYDLRSVSPPIINARERKPEVTPSRMPCLINGLRMKLGLAPTSCMFLIRNLLAYTVNLTVLFIRARAIRKQIPAKLTSG